MPANYDLVVLGGTLEGRQAALSAAGYGARVALIEPPELYARRQQSKHLLKGLQQIAEGYERQAVIQWFHKSDAKHLADDGRSFNLPALVEWSAIAAKTQHSEYALSSLNASGVDVIGAMPEQLSRDMVVTAGGRSLATRGVLAAFGTVPLPCDSERNSLISGVESLLRMQRLPEQLFVWGEGMEAIAWAEALSTLGVQVTLVADVLLRGEDTDVRGLVRSQLVAKGIRLTAPLGVLDPKTTRKEKQALAAQSLLLGATQPALTLPNFVYHPVRQYPDADNQTHLRTYLRCNKHLQTAHPRVFACGALLHGQAVSEATAQQEMKIAIQNALFIPNQKVDYAVLSTGQGRIARAGLAPQFALQRSAPPDGYTVWTASSANSADLSRVSPLPNYCKLICKRNRLQSIHLVGDRASELVEQLTPMLNRPVRNLLGTLSGLPTQASAEDLKDLVHVAASQATQYQWQPGQWRRDWAENWFNWRRSRQR